jgi:hypothetical protein
MPEGKAARITVSDCLGSQGLKYISQVWVTDIDTLWVLGYCTLASLNGTRARSLAGPNVSQAVAPGIILRSDLFQILHLV